MLFTTVRRPLGICPYKVRPNQVDKHTVKPTAVWPLVVRDLHSTCLLCRLFTGEYADNRLPKMQSNFAPLVTCQSFHVS